MEDSDLNSKADKFAQQAVEMAEKRGMRLDFSNESVVTVEKILELLHKQHQEKPMDEQFARQLASLFGSYVGNTLIKNLGKGKWGIDPKTNEPSVIIDGTYMFFPAKAYKRIMNGPEDNIIQMYVTEYNRFAPTPISLPIFG